MGYFLVRDGFGKCCGTFRSDIEAARWPALGRNPAGLVAENLALRQQLAVLKSKRPRRRLTDAGRIFWVLPSRDSGPAGSGHRLSYSPKRAFVGMSAASTPSGVGSLEPRSRSTTREQIGLPRMPERRPGSLTGPSFLILPAPPSEPLCPPSGRRTEPPPEAGLKNEGFGLRDWSGS